MMYEEEYEQVHEVSMPCPGGGAGDPWALWIG